VEMVKALVTPYVNVKSVHLQFERSPEQLAAARREIEAAGLVIVGGGVITFDDDTDPGVEKYFAYAKAAGMPLIAIHTDPKLLPRIERFAKQYDIKVAIHNHGPEDKNFPSPYDALKHIRNMDRHIGLCIDIGHTVRTGTDVVRAVADAGPRVLDLHLNALRAPTLLTRGGEMSKKTKMRRREFLQVAAAALPAARYARILGANDRVRVGIVGFSDRFRQALLPAFGKVGKELNFEIVAVSDIW